MLFGTVGHVSYLFVMCQTFLSILCRDTILWISRTKFKFDTTSTLLLIIFFANTIAYGDFKSEYVNALSKHSNVVKWVYLLMMSSSQR